MDRESARREFEHILKETEAGRSASIERTAGGKRYVRRFIPEDRLILLGGGHIAVPLCRIASLLDFSVTVVDDRPRFANTGRFPDAAHVVCDRFETAIRDLKIRPTDYVCVITRGHRWDKECLQVILQGADPSYLGMIGSRRRVSGLLALLKEEGFDPERLAAIHTPIGLKIGAETSAEIALSICAEMVLHRRSHPEEEEEALLERTDTDFGLLHYLAEGEAQGALMLVLQTRGSTPVESGAIMAVDRIGNTYGTIGGGCGEADVMSMARRIAGTGETRVVEVDMTNEVAEEEGMVCGGIMQVLIEDLAVSE